MKAFKSKLIQFALSIFFFLCSFNYGYSQSEQITIDKSDTVIDCKGGYFNDGKSTYLVISSINTTNGWIQTKNITIQNCTIKGGIRILGLGKNGQAAGVKESSFSLGHTERAKAAAPTNIKFSNVIIEATDGLTPMYLAPGTTYVTVENCTFSGVNTGSGPVVYLDAESGDNTFRNNIFRTTVGREVLACDGSANNVIDGNKFETAAKGGIYLYRNCGEGGTVRHQTPNHNTISNNTFNLNGLSLGSYGIWLGSRNGNRNYCDDDIGYAFGSSIDNHDFADYNIVNSNIFEGTIFGIGQIKNDGQNNLINVSSDINNTNADNELKISIFNGTVVLNNLIGDTSIRVFDYTGRVLINKVLTNNILEFPFASKQIYFIYVSNGARTWIKKVIVK
ncbi:MAG: hypothetical protein GZ091_04850 [Paludibacter sp.]|nr:hypothetical protein [Paludibacter sp.]